MERGKILTYSIILLLFGGFLIFLYFAQGKITGYVVLEDVEGTLFEGFESGLLATNNWTTSGAGTPWYIDTYNPSAGIYHAMVKPTGAESIVEMNISTLNYNDINFSFYAQTGGLDAGEYIMADWYNGTTWVNVLNQEDIFPYTFYIYSLPSSASNNPNFKIQFRCLGNLNNEVCQIDNVQVSGTVIKSDTIFPNITINIPANNSFSSSASQDINFTVQDNNLNTCWYSNDTYTANTTLANCNINITMVQWAEGQHNVTIWVNDSANSVNSSMVTFTIDTTFPTLSFTTPITNTSNLSQNFITANLSFTEINLDVANISLYNSTQNIINSATGTTSPLYINFSGLSDGRYYLNATLSDLAGNTNQTETRIIGLDRVAPNLTINSPSATTYTNSTILFNATAIDSTTLINSCWYTINSGATNQTLSKAGALNSYNFTASSIADGSYTARFYCNDSANNVNNTENVAFTIDTSTPNGGNGGGGGGGGSSSKKLNSSASEILESPRDDSPRDDTAVPSGEPNNKISNLQNFSNSLVNEQIEISLIDVNRRKGFVNAEYIVKNLAGEDQNVDLYFSVLDLKENIKSEIEEVHFISANSEKDFGTSIFIGENLNEELILIIDFKKYSSISEDASAPIRSRVSGFSVFNIEDNNKKSLFLIILFLLLFILVLFSLYKIIKNRKMGFFLEKRNYKGSKTKILF